MKSVGGRKLQQFQTTSAQTGRRTVKIVADKGGWKLQAMDGQIFQSR